MASWSDYVLFVMILALSTFIGIYFGFFGSRQRTADEYLMGKRKMQIIPIALSVAVSQFSAATLLGVPADIYRYGASYWLTCISMVLFVIINNYIFMPVFYDLQTTSAYEYLGKRFDKKVKMFAFFLMVVTTILYLPIVAYAPSLAFSIVTGIDIHLVSFIVSAVCVFYTAIGGLKAVVWTDVIQFASIIISLLSVFLISVRSIGGLQPLWNKALQGQRLDIFSFDPNPLKRESFWILVIGYTVQMVGQVSIHQNGVQKFLTLPNLSASRWSAAFFAITMSVLATFCVFIGLVTFVQYADCDPVLNGEVGSYDQLVPLFLLDVAGGFPGISGLFLAALLSTALSTMSSNLNALAAVIYTDFLNKALRPSEEHVGLILKLIVVISGIICTILAVLISDIREGIFPLTVTLSAVALGPLLGVFTLGLLVPKANAKGGFYGMLCGFILIACLIVPANYYKTVGLLKYPEKSFSVAGCNNTENIANSESSFFNAALTNTTTSSVEAPFIFKISFYYYTLLGALFTIILGWCISSMTNKYDLPVERRLISPICRCFVKKYIGTKRDVKYSTLEMAELKPSSLET